MAHNLNYNEQTGQHAFMSVKQKAWHELGQVVEDYPTAEECIQLAGLDYEVEKQKIFTADGTEIKTHFATTRTDTNKILGVVGSKYQIVQNRTAFSFFDALVADSTGIKYETAGALGNGERIFITAKMPEVIRVGRGKTDDIEEYIFLTTSHDATTGIIAAFTPIRIVCNNTLQMALQNHTNAVYIKHTANAEYKLREAAKIISLSQNMHDILEPMFNNWASVRIHDWQLKKLIDLAMAPNMEVFTAVAKENKAFEFSTQFKTVCSEVYEYALTNETQQFDTTKGTLYGAYNAISGFYQNVKEYKSADQKTNSIMFGTALDRTKKAFELCSNAELYLS